MELRGHEHVVECSAFAPVSAYPAIRELSGMQVSCSSSCKTTLAYQVRRQRQVILEQNRRAHTLRLVRGIRPSSYGTLSQANVYTPL